MPTASSHEHRFECRLTWTGASRAATTSYDAYSRDVLVEIDGKPALAGSAAPAFRGDGEVHNPEDLLMASLAECHCLSYLALAARAGIAVVGYEDRATGILAKIEGKFRFREVTLHPRVWIAPGASVDRARVLHEKAHSECFIANSVNFPVRNEPEILVR
jgi:organic hydroperoxide reductase OsmC/OhrA